MPSKVIDSVRLIQKCILVNESKEMLALHRTPDDHSRGGCWDLPGGGYELGEMVYDAIAREVQEEAGITIRSFYPVYFSNRLNIKSGLFAGLNVFALCYVCTDWAGEVHLSDEHDAYRWVTPREFAQLDFGEDGGFFSESISAYTALPHSFDIFKK